MNNNLKLIIIETVLSWTSVLVQFRISAEMVFKQMCGLSNICGENIKFVGKIFILIIL